MQGEPPAATEPPESASAEPEGRERPVPLDLMARCEAVGIPKQFADKHGAPIDAVRWHIQEIQGFWSIGPGAGQRRRNWLHVVRSRLHELAKAGKLDEWSGVSAPAARDASAALAALERANAMARAKADAASGSAQAGDHEQQRAIGGMVAGLVGSGAS
jgi:hypothetical protein